MNIRLVSFNIRCCDDPDGNSIGERSPRLKKVITPLDADVICFQEVRPKWIPEITRNFSDEYEMYLCYRSEEKPEGLITLWRRERFFVKQKGLFWFSDTPEKPSLGWDEKYNCPRICSYTLLEDRRSGKSFLAMNTHYGFGDEGQVKCAGLIKRYRDLFPTVKAFVCGDFNMRPDSPGYLALKEFFYDANENTVNDRRATYHAYMPSADQKSHIDFIFCDSQISTKDFRILDESVDGKYPSDHFGIFSELLF